MFISLEITPPKRNVEKISNIINMAKGLFDTINLTDTPIGEPRIPSFILAILLKHRFNIEPIVHYKTVNMNSMMLKSVLYGCVASGVRKFLFMRGDNPVEGSTISDISPEDLAIWARNELGIETGLAIGWPTSVERIASKLMSKPNYVFTQVFLTLRDAEDFRRMFDKAAEKVGWKPPVYCTHLAHCEESIETLRQVAESMGIKSPDFRIGVDVDIELLEGLSRFFDGFMISSPGNYEYAIKLAETIRSKHTGLENDC
ncbi:MAG: methylenetetrahydrofolate reductase [Crenarchaeota archaeon]|nr:methylenetetrahydrofolate reductase [Thermoproteota archaeon]MDW8033417.1 methylenetetrahydrofolate reductase [Nitrososphaerota archaeon]